MSESFIKVSALGNFVNCEIVHDKDSTRSSDEIYLNARASKMLLNRLEEALLHLEGAVCDCHKH
ncbi:hypothetical protein [Ureibacillus xyleni]|nr:hypothetical protein [Ureibacillus xyleni]